jgi:iron(III) transport system substrate-binding protein
MFTLGCFFVYHLAGANFLSIDIVRSMIKTSRTHRALKTILALAGTASILAACGSTSSASSSTTTASKTKSPVVPLVVYGAEGYAPAVAKGFQQATGIPTEMVNHSTGTLLAKISAEAENPQWGVFWSDGSDAYAALDQQHYLLRNFEPTTGTLTTLGKTLVPADGSYIPTGLTIAGAFVYNSKVLTSPPTSWNSLLTSQWKGALGMNNPAISGPTYTAVASIMQQQGGVAAGEAYFKKLAANGLHIYSTNKVTLSALLKGQIKVALVQNSAGIGFAMNTPGLKVAYPDKSALLPSVIGIDGKASKTEIAEAKKFADFVYSPKGQALMLSGDPQGDSLFFPIIEGTKAHSEVPNLKAIPTDYPNPLVWGPRESTINAWFTNNIVQ